MGGGGGRRGVNGGQRMGSVATEHVRCPSKEAATGLGAPDITSITTLYIALTPSSRMPVAFVGTPTQFPAIEGTISPDARDDTPDAESMIVAWEI